MAGSDQQPHMNSTFLNNINQQLIKAIRDKYHYDEAKVLLISEAGRSSVIGSLKQFVLKNGTAEIEGILLDKVPFNSSKLRVLAFDNFQKDIAGKKILDASTTHEVADFSINFLIEQFKEGFNRSGFSRDLDGICNFLEIDKKLIKLANSPVTKFFGKLF